jgi:excisionase family DNA binding protein
VTDLPDKKTFRPGEVARLLDISPSTVYLWIEVGKIEATRLAGRTLRIPREEIERIRESTTE